MKLTILLLYIAAKFLPVYSSTCQLFTEQCGGPVIEPSEVKKYCQSPLNLIDNGRCCVNATGDNFTDTDIVGLDLRNCNIHNVTGLFKNLTSVVVMSLENNTLSKVTEEDFYNLTQLQDLSLPDKLKECPGGALAWELYLHANGTLWCKTQLNTCDNEENNATCPSPKSYCSPSGPGLVDCLCSPGYHGYKCLRQGTFPMIPFVAGICGSTVLVSAFLWITQRRHVKKHTS